MNESQRTLIAVRDIRQLAGDLERHLTQGGDMEHAAWLHIDLNELEKAVEMLGDQRIAIQVEFDAAA